jgi:hypothetical protein
MSKKVTSSSPIKTLAFDAIPNYWTYANTVTKHKPPTVDTTSGGADGSYYASPLEPTTGGSNLGDTGPDTVTDPCAGLTDEQCQKLKGKSGTPTNREQRLLDRISKSKNPAQIARLEKRLGGHLWREDKAMARKEYRAGEIGKGKTFFGRLIQGGENLFEQDPHKRHEHLRTASGTAKNPDSKDRERSLTKINLGKERAKCNSDDTKVWDKATDKCIDKPNVNPNANNPSNIKNQTATHLSKHTNPKACNYGGGYWSQGKCYKR